MCCVTAKNNPNYASELIEATRNLELELPDQPAQPAGDNVTQFDIEIWKETYKEWKKKRAAFTNFLASLYTLVWNTCTVAMREKVQEVAATTLKTGLWKLERVMPCALVGDPGELSRMSVACFSHVSLSRRLTLRV